MTITPSCYLAPIPFFSAMLKDDNVMVEQYDNYIKQTFRNRCIIAGPNGTQTLTIPVEKSTNHKCLMKDLRISDHGNWRHLHWNALESSYGKSPFFEYYADDLRPFYERKWEFLVDYNEEMQNVILQLLDIEIHTRRTDRYIKPSEAEIHDSKVLDLRPLAEPSLLNETIHDSLMLKGCTQPYYQVFAPRHGFIPNLSIVDLLFNMGPEAVLHLMK